MRRLPGSDIGVADGGIGHDGLRCAVGDHAAVVEDDEATAGADDFFEIVLDEDDRDALSIDGRDRFRLPRRLGLIEAGERLVEKHDAWAEGQRAGEFEPFQLAERQRSGRPILGSGKPDLGEYGGGAFAFDAAGDMEQGA